jgi:hypothetical protein
MKYKISLVFSGKWISQVSDERGSVLYKSKPTGKIKARVEAVKFIEEQKGFKSYEDIIHKGQIPN